MSTADGAVRFLATTLVRLADSLSTEELALSFLRDLGWSLASAPPQIVALETAAGALSQLWPSLQYESLTAETAGQATEAVVQLWTAVAALDGTVAPTGAAGFTADLARQILDYWVVDTLRDLGGAVLPLLQLAGIVEIDFVPEALPRLRYIARRVRWDLFPALLNDPEAAFRARFGWGTPAFDAAHVLGHIADVLEALRATVSIKEPPAAELAGAGGTATDAAGVDLELIAYEEAGAPVAAGVRFLPLVPTSGLPGLALVPYVIGSLGERFALDARTTVTIDASFDLAGGVVLGWRPDTGLALTIDLGTGGTSAAGMMSGRFEYADPSLVPWTIIGAESGSRIEAVSLAGVGALRLVTATDSELSVELELRGGRIVIAAGEGDAFLRRVLPADGLAASFDLAIGLSTKRGLYFRGSGGLSVTVPVHASLGPISLESLSFDVRASAAGMPITVGATVSVALGPIVAVAKNVGLRAAFTFPGSDGNLGPVDVDVGFKSPDGIGLSLDGGGFRGGGYIEHDEARGRYAGIVDLEFQSSLAVTGIGILDTRLPDGRDGYSLLIAISARFAAIQLGMGFTLNGVGGLIAVNRTARIDVLRASLKDHTLNSLLFPENPIENADRIISDLDRVFPPAPGQFVFAPMARIGWGTPTLITADLGLIIALPDPVRVAIVGVVRCVLPDPDAPLLVLQANFLGTINLDKGYLAFDASLFESHLLSFKLDGDMSARLTIGLVPSLLLAVGGFHPAYKPPPMELPTMRRVVISLLADDNPRLRAEVYFARTANSFQFGANLELYVAVSKFNIHGVLGFDVLLQIKPTFFSASVRASLAVCIGDDPILSVGVDFMLEGPAPWHAKGSAHFKICWFLSFSKSFDHTWGDEQEIGAAEIDVLPLLVAALSAPTNWRSKLPDGVHQLVRFRETTLDLIDPAGSLTITQSVVPLNLTIDRFSGSKPRDANRFWINSLTSAGAGLANEPTTEEFAPAEFLDLSDTDKLGRPSFEPFTSGVVITGVEDLVADHVVAREVEYEEIIVDRVNPGRSTGKAGLHIVSFAGLIQGGSVSRSPFARNLAFTPVTPTIALAIETYVVVSSSNLRAVSDGAELNHAQALEAMKRMMKASPNLEGTLQVVPSYAVSP